MLGSPMTISSPDPAAVPPPSASAPGDGRTLPARIRVGLVMGSLELGGAERQAVIIAEHLHRRGAELMVFGMGAPGRAAAMLDRLGVPWRSLPRIESRFAAMTWLRVRKAASIIATHRPDALLGFTNPANMTCGLARQRCAARTCVWYQLDEGLNRFSPRLERSASRACTRFIANSRGGARFLAGALGIAAADIEVVRNGVALAPAREGRAAWRRQIGVDDDVLVACMIANLSHAKDHRTLIEAWPGVCSQLAPRRVVLVLAGRFDDAHAGLLALVDRLGIGHSVRILGPVDDIAGLVGAVDLGVFSSRSEGCPNGVLECMSAGLAVAATDIPGIREALGDGAAPYLAGAGDAGALAAAVVSLARDDRARQLQGIANRARVASEFAPEAMLERIERALLPAGAFPDLARCASR
jgi:glycosyltransferase involved in cell wall biosynthesis